jgi:hypothetical protein
MGGNTFASPRVARRALLLFAVLALAGCSSDGEESTTGVSVPQVTTAPPATVAAETTEADRAQQVYDAYFQHCKEFTYQALAYPRTASDATDAARQYAGPPRQYQRPAFRGCLAGLRLGTPRITLADVKRVAAEEAEEHGDG